jgi:hypothetical protein
MKSEQQDDFVKPGRQRTVNKAKKRRGEQEHQAKLGEVHQVRKRITARDVYATLDEIDLGDE